MRNTFSFIVLIVLVLVVELFVGVAMAYFSNNKEVLGTITLAELDFTVDCEFAQNMKVVPNEKVLCDFVLKNCKENGDFENLIDFYFRMNITGISNNTNINISPIFNDKNWIFVDGFYYYVNIVHKNERIDICNKVLIDKDTGNNVQGKNMEINILFEAIQINAVQDIWGSNILEKIINY